MRYAFKFVVRGMILSWIPVFPALASSNCLDGFAVFSKESSDLRDRSKILYGNIGSNTLVELGVEANLTGDLTSGGNGILRDRASIEGNATTGGTLTRHNQTLVTGVVAQNAVQPPCAIPEKGGLTTGSADINVEANQTITLQPGKYRDLQVFSGSTVNLQKGVYDFRSFRLEPDVQVLLQENTGTEINVWENLVISDRTTIAFKGASNPLALKFYSHQQATLRLGADSRLTGVFTVPRAEISITSRVHLIGNLFAKKITVEPDVLICNPPRAVSIHHSEGAYGPFFDPNNLEYLATVPASTTQLELGAVLERAGDVLSVNGGAETTVSMTGESLSVDLRISRPAMQGFPAGCFESHYKLMVKKSPDYSIRVNESTPCSGQGCDGTSWAKALPSLQAALAKAQETGKELWIAEGTYLPSERGLPSNARTATFTLKPGAELRGAFEGTETTPEPAGDIRETILSGDLNRDDAGITAWPPSASTGLALLSDNAYHVLTFAGGPGAMGASIRDLSIRHGSATGSGLDAFGAGILNARSAPEISRCIVQKNAASTGGGGLFNGYSPSRFSDNLIRENITFDGRGGGVYNASVIDMVMDRVAFLDNHSLSGAGNAGGGGLFCVGSNATLFNSVFAGNASDGDGGAVLNFGGSLLIRHATLTRNSGAANGGIANVGGSVSISNTILWQNTGGEIKGANFSVDHTLVTGGYPGTGNLSADPLFEAPADPEGGDDSFFSLDDGLQLQPASPAVDAGIPLPAEQAQLDILQSERPINGDDRNGEEPDLGAYEFLNIKPIEANLVGNYHEITGAFKVIPNLLIIDNMADRSELGWLAKSSAAYTIQTTIKKNKHLKDSFYGNLTAINNNVPVGPGFRVNFYKVGESGNSVTYSTQRARGNGTVDGKPLILVTEAQFESGTDPRAYVLRSSPGSVLRFVVPHRQFR